MAGAVWWYFFCKVIELLDTVSFNFLEIAFLILLILIKKDKIIFYVRFSKKKIATVEIFLLATKIFPGRTEAFVFPFGKYFFYS